ncbi:MAG TPA: ABC transporter ATP-binding protein [Chloroflexi bacterium]|nr:ABC transporter ATP-binding protein [Chloroflexota bacterium]|tara:strand:+ start:2100 stop:2801 length:702 start_codon:yes stop_codon:yes gene_type:complete
MTILLLDKINSFYGKNHVLRDISLKVIKKEIVSILGKNGAGKSTIIKSIIGTQPITKGDVYLYDTQITKLESHKIVRKGIGILNQGNSVFPTLTVLENIMLGHQNNKNNMWDIEKILDLFPGLMSKLHCHGWQISGGEKQMVGLSRALMTNPKLLLLDEPSEGLAPQMLQKLGVTIKKLTKQGISVLMVEQNAHFAIDLSDRIYIINKGKVIFDDPNNGNNNQNMIIDTYLTR